MAPVQAADSAFLEVSGVGEVAVRPGMAQISFAVESIEADASAHGDVRDRQDIERR